MAGMAGRVAMITGAAGGIGEATAHKLASRGISVFVIDMNEKDGSRVSDEVEKKWNVRSKFLKVDITQEEQVKDAIASTTKWTGRLDYAANCAGICESIWAEEESITTELFERTYAINTRGLWLCQKYQALQMRMQQPREITFLPQSPHTIPGQRGAIANVVSISGLQAAGLAAYTPSKYAAIGVTKNGAKFYGPSGIRVNALCPGWTLTKMVEHSMGKEGTIGTQENKDSGVSKQIGLRRMAFAQEQANVLSFLLSDESSYMNGSLLVNDGGFHDIR
ncbi:3-oxoacyl-reductase [Exophiala viscosa]|uniref:3-oxoacyl-reductase n=1 Tax=Exophiala viscosa TaxID=2486360 RepID=UPI002197E8D4|nr:3-oxoacyl-reductase [Exophiala viscosa]